MQGEGMCSGPAGQGGGGGGRFENKMVIKAITQLSQVHGAADTRVKQESKHNLNTYWLPQFIADAFGNKAKGGKSQENSEKQKQNTAHAPACTRGMDARKSYGGGSSHSHTRPLNKRRQTLDLLREDKRGILEVTRLLNWLNRNLVQRVSNTKRQVLTTTHTHIYCHVCIRYSTQPQFFFLPIGWFEEVVEMIVCLCAWSRCGSCHTPLTFV